MDIPLLIRLLQVNATTAAAPGSVLLGTASCDVVSFNDTHISCIASSHRPGPASVSIMWSHLGSANGDLTFYYQIAILQVSVEVLLDVCGATYDPDLACCSCQLSC